MEKLIKISLKGGLNNKIIRLRNILPLALENKTRILEPNFGWPRTNKNEKFSKLFDLEYFNAQIENIYGMRNIIVSQDEYLDGKKFHIETRIKCHQKSGDTLKKTREFRRLDQLHELQTNMLNSLRPSSEIEKVVDGNLINDLVAVQLRIERDWQRYTNHGKRKKNKKSHETLLVTQQDFIDMFKSSELYSKRIFFTTGENHEDVKNIFKSAKIDAQYFYDSNLGYETNATINFFLCVSAYNFIGHTRSSFSLNVSASRILNGKHNSYSHNLYNKIAEINL